MIDVDVKMPQSSTSLIKGVTMKLNPDYENILNSIDSVSPASNDQLQPLKKKG